MHTAVAMAHRHLPSQLPAALVWPYDCTKRCNDLVPVTTGPHVAEEMTRNLREPFRTQVRRQF